MSASICLAASSGCNYPEGECLGTCMDKNKALPEPDRLKGRAVLRIDELGEDLKNHVPIDIGDHPSAAQVVWKMDGSDERSPEKEAVARRLVACWNACLDEDTAMLEAIVAEGTTIRKRHDEALCLKETYQRELCEVERQRDKMLAALNEADRTFEMEGYSADGPTRMLIRAAVATTTSQKDGSA